MIDTTAVVVALCGLLVSSLIAVVALLFKRILSEFDAIKVCVSRLATKVHGIELSLDSVKADLQKMEGEMREARALAVKVELMSQEIAHWKKRGSGNGEYLDDDL